MMTTEQLTEVLGWSTILNIGLMMLSTTVLVWVRGPISKLHSGMFGLGQSELPRLYFQYLGFYKIAIFIFNLMPYVALKIVA